MDKNYRFLIIYLAIVFPLAWGILISCNLFADSLAPIIGKLTLTHPIIIFVLYLPSIAGLFIYYMNSGLNGVIGIVKKLILRKQDLFWFPIILAIFILFALTMRFGSSLFGLETPAITFSFMQLFMKALWNFIEEVGLLGGIFGWIGFLLPYLQSKFKNNIISALLTGFIFGLWVLPGYGISSVTATTSYILYVFQLMSFLVFASYIFNASNGNLSLYLFAFWLAATGSHIQLYNFVLPVQVMEILFLTCASIILHYCFKKLNIRAPLQTFPNFILTSARKREELNLAQEI